MDNEQEYTIEDVQRESQAFVEKDAGEPVQLINFKLGEEEYALKIDQVKEIVVTPRIANVPQTPDFLKGVANIRGNIIAIIDLERKFNLNTAGQEWHHGLNYTLVIESENHKVGILVREVPNTLTVDASEIDQSTDIIQFSSLEEQCIAGIVKVDDRMIIQINMQELMRTIELTTKVSETK